MEAAVTDLKQIVLMDWLKTGKMIPAHDSEEQLFPALPRSFWSSSTSETNQIKANWLQVVISVSG